METEQNKPISQNELDLTEEELNRIFFGSENKITEEQSNPDSTKEKTPKSNKPKKLKREKTLTIPPVIPPNLEELEKIQSEPEPEKRPQGRPLKWTEEKKEQLKLENKKQAQQRRLEKSDIVRMSKLSTQEPITHCEIERIVNKAIKTKEEIEKHITEKRTIIKNILKQENVSYLRRSDNCNNHLYKLHHFSENGAVVVVCIHCSCREEMDIYKWNLYLARNRNRL